MLRPIFFFKKFFINYFWIGIVLILASLLAESYILKKDELNRLISILISLFETIGISIIVASIFTFASGSSEFVTNLKNLLENIVVKRNFLGNIDPEGKKEALKSLIQPSDLEKNKYPNIGDYYGYFINKTLDIGKKSVRSNYQVNSRAFYDRDKKKLAIDGSYSYRVYPSKDGFHDIELGFLKILMGLPFVNTLPSQHLMEIEQ